MEKISHVRFIIWKILILLAAVQEFASGQKTPGDCLHVETNFIVIETYEPKRCPEEIDKFEDKELLFDCFKDVFRKCTPTQTLKCINEHGERKMICVEKSTVVPPEAPVISIKEVNETSITLLISSSSQNGTAVVNFYKVTYKEINTTNITVIRKAAHNNYDNKEVVLSDLIPETRYIILVEARDKYGNSARATMITANTTSPLAGPPSEFPGWAIGVICISCIAVVGVVIVTIYHVYHKKRNRSYVTSTDNTDLTGGQEHHFI